jgi:ubiquitin-protein ligase
MMKRLAREVADLQRGDLSGIGIYTWFDETNIRHGKAMLIGPEGTPYAFCPLFFDIVVPNEYPLVPPKVHIETTDSMTRLHPNLYTGGKVCLSILGTYTGPSWVSTMNIETVLKSIYSLLNENPITNEPGWENYTLNNPRAKEYADCVQYALANLTIEQFRELTIAGGHPLWDPFRDILLSSWKTDSLPRLCQLLSERAVQIPIQTFSPLLYGMTHRNADWSHVATAATVACQPKI